MKFKRILLLIFATIVLQLSSCNQKPAAEKATGKLQGLHKYYYPDGELYLEVNFKDSIPDGTFKQYFKNGQLFEETNYRNGVRHGVSKKFFEDGKPSSEIAYDSGRIHGLHKKFRKDGSLAFEAPYHYDKPCVGLKEYYLSGDPVVNYPKIVFTPKDAILKSNRYTLEISMSDGSKSVEYFRGALAQGKYVDENTETIVSVKGIGRIDYFMPPGAFVMEKVNVIAKVKTDLGNFYYTQQSHNVAVENR